MFRLANRQEIVSYAAAPAIALTSTMTLLAVTLSSVPMPFASVVA